MERGVSSKGVVIWGNIWGWLGVVITTRLTITHSQLSYRNVIPQYSDNNNFADVKTDHVKVFLTISLFIHYMADFQQKFELFRLPLWLDSNPIEVPRTSFERFYKYIPTYYIRKHHKFVYLIYLCMLNS